MNFTKINKRKPMRGDKHLKDRNKQIIYGMIGVVFTFAMTFLLVYKSADRFDYDNHLLLAKNLFNGENGSIVTYPAWHLLCWFCLMFFGESTSAALTTALLNVFAFIVIWAILGRRFKYNLIVLLISCGMMICGPLYVPMINKEYFLGQLSTNIWHNPTHIAVKGIALLSAWLLYKCICEKPDNKYYVYLSIFTALSIFFKPSYAQVALPAVVILYFVMLLSGKMDWKSCIKNFFALLPTAIGILLQYMGIWGTETAVTDGGGIAIGLFQIWGKYSSHILGSILISLMFPMCVMLCYGKSYFSTEKNRFFMIMFGVAFLEYAMLYETGERMVAGNFGWGLQLATFFLFFNSVYEMLRLRDNSTKHGKAKFITCASIFALHTLCGIWYYFYIVMNGSYRTR